MVAEKTLSMSFRVSPKFSALLKAAAARENRSLTNMLERLVFEHCEQNGVTVTPTKRSKSAGAAR